MHVHVSARNGLTGSKITLLTIGGKIDTASISPIHYLMSSNSTYNGYVTAEQISNDRISIYLNNVTLTNIMFDLFFIVIT